MLSTGYNLKKEMISRNNPNQTITNTIYKIKIKNSVKKEKKKHTFTIGWGAKVANKLPSFENSILVMGF